jgi:murein DD-endopeptidase MepM/ murein hydrolase activator NlpD
VVALGLLVLLLPSWVGPVLPGAALAAADPRADHRRVQSEVAEAEATLEHATARARKAAARLAAAEAELPDAEARLDQARGSALAAAAEADTAEQEAAAARAELAAAGARVEDSFAAVDRARGRVTAFAVAAYKGSRLAAVNLLLRAGGAAEAGERLGYLDHVAGVKRERVDRLAAARLAARQAENEASLARDRTEAARRATAEALERTRETEAWAESAAADAEALAAERAGALAVADTEREESLAQYQRVEAEAARIEAELREWQARRAASRAASGGTDRSGGTDPPGGPSAAGFVLPTRGWQSSPFGMRFDPFFGVWQVHAGVDIAAPGGTPIWAVAGGTVIRAGWNGGYGNLTCLGHGSYWGQGLATCYGHQSEILVGAGQSVRRGELIGRVGTTGASTGTHLHFEVRLDGTPTNPSPFLPPLR